METDEKIIGVGFHKTGTSTLREALKILGYRVKDTTPRALIPILRGKYHRVARMIRRYDAVEDTPWFMVYRQLDKQFPGSRFILTIRDEASWYRSISNHIGSLRAAHHEWIYGRGYGLPKDNKENSIRVYRTHNREVMEYFSDRPDDLLVLDFTKGDGWNKLCEFLGRPVPDRPFPHVNKTSEASGKQKRARGSFRYYRKSVKNQFKIWLIDAMRWW
jgi:hypothetical protein